MNPSLIVPAIGILLGGLGCSNTSNSSPSTSPGGTPAAASAPRPARNFHFEYNATVTGIPAGAGSVRVWVPLPQSDENQTVSNLKIESPIAHRETRDAEYGNRIAYFEAAGPAPASLPINVSYDVRRVETSSSPKLAGATQRRRLLAGDRLAPTAGEAEARAAQAVAAGQEPQARARALYERVLADVDYSKAVPGWGQGDLSYVCKVGKGNCSDFHALFISMARSQQIPALFEIGFPLPADKKEGAVLGYHCWAWYEDSAGGTWRPVDISEADKDPGRQEFFFNNICANRVALSRGRDITLEPPQAGPALNYFIYPHVEIAGKPVESGIEKAFAFNDLPAAAASD